MKNLANTKPPEFFKIDNNFYSINYDYLIWIDVLELLEDLDFDNISEDATKEEILGELAIIEEIEVLVFGVPIQEDIFTVLRHITGFAAGYPQYRNKDVGISQSCRVFDFKLDLNSILIAIRDQSGIDLSNYDGLFHWWRFLLEFDNLTGEHHICKLMELRAYDGDDKDMKRARDAVALPLRVSKKQQRFDDEMDEVFYNC